MKTKIKVDLFTTRKKEERDKSILLYFRVGTQKEEGKIREKI